MNPKFICVKYDMEKGEGPELAKKFGVRAYPTFVILNTDGTVRLSLIHILIFFPFALCKRISLCCSGRREMA